MDFKIMRKKMSWMTMISIQAEALTQLVVMTQAMMKRSQTKENLVMGSLRSQNLVRKRRNDFERREWMPK